MRSLTLCTWNQQIQSQEVHGLWESGEWKAKLSLRDKRVAMATMLMIAQLTATESDTRR